MRRMRLNQRNFSVRELGVCLLIIAVLSISLGALLHAKEVWPFVEEPVAQMLDAIDITGSRKAAREKIISDQKKLDELQKIRTAKIADEKRRNYTISTNLHRLKIKLIEAIPESQLAIISTDNKQIEFLLFSIENPVLMHGRLDIESQSLEIKNLGAYSSASTATDIYVSPRSGKVYASYVAIDERTCASIKLDEINLSDSQFSTKNIFSSDCVLPPYWVRQTGGRIQEDGADNLYLTIGDFQHSALAGDRSSHFGKIMVKRSNQSKFQVFSSGHRNAQGLFWDSETNKLYETEHGPRGGDEINIVEQNMDYGWPHRTYGTTYGTDPEGPFLSNSATQYGKHSGYKKPIHAYTPSIGIGQIKKMPRRQYEFPNWKSNFLVAGMTSGGLVRLVIENDRVILNEQINTGRIRDFFITDAGMIIASRPDGVVIIRRDKGNRN